MIESHEQDLSLTIQSSQQAIEAQQECIALFIGLLEDLVGAFDQNWESTWDLVSHLEAGVLPRARNSIKTYRANRPKEK